MPPTALCIFFLPAIFRANRANSSTPSRGSDGVRAVSIRPYLVGDLPAGYLLGETTLSPERALVSGPTSLITKLNEVTTERIIMTGRTATFVQDVVVVSDSPLVRVITPVTTQVTVPVLAQFGPNPPPG